MSLASTEEVAGANVLALSDVTDSLGNCLFRDLPQGRWELTVEAEGFRSYVQEFDWPPSGSEEVETDAAAVHVAVELIPERLVSFRLVGFEHWDRFDLFSLESLEDRRPVSMGENGLVWLSYGELPEVLQVKVSYPDGVEAWEAFDRDEIVGRQPLEIVVGGSQLLEVDLIVGAHMIEKLGELELYVRATFTDPRGSERFLAKRFGSPGVYRFPQVQADVVNVGLVEQGELQQIEWAAAERQLRREGVTAVQLVVESQPTVLRAVDGEGLGMAAASWRAVPKTSRSGWMAGGTADADGTFRVPPWTFQGPALLSIESSDGRRTLFDFEVHLAGAASPVDIVVGQATETFVEVQDRYGPVAGEVYITGNHSTGFEEFAQLTDTGRTRSIGLVQGSNGRFELDLPQHWTAAQSWPLKPGQNRVVAYRLGRLSSESPEDLGRYAHVELQASVSDWMAQGLVQVVQDELGCAALVPSGTYTSLGPDGSSQTVEVAPLEGR